MPCFIIGSHWLPLSPFSQILCHGCDLPGVIERQRRRRNEREGDEGGEIFGEVLHLVLFDLAGPHIALFVQCTNTFQRDHLLFVIGLDPRIDLYGIAVAGNGHMQLKERKDVWLRRSTECDLRANIERRPLCSAGVFETHKG